MYSINEFMPPPIVAWELDEVRVGEFPLGLLGVVRVLMPGHAVHPSIV